jgi:hypothetical protein
MLQIFPAPVFLVREEASIASTLSGCSDERPTPFRRLVEFMRVKAESTSSFKQKLDIDFGRASLQPPTDCRSKTEKVWLLA